MKTAVLDGDVIAYMACSAAASQTVLDWGEDFTDVEPGPGRPIEIADQLIDEWTERAGAQSAIIALSGDAEYNFRRDIHPEYKRSRPDDKPECYEDVVAWMLQSRGGINQLKLEGDDIMGLLLTQGDADVAVSTDKDVYTLPGQILRIPHSSVKNPHYVVETNTLRMANLYWMRQTLTGDTVDEYRGAPGVGPVAAEKILDGCLGLNTMWNAVLKAYNKQSLNKTWGPKFVYKDAPVKEALMNAQVARILRHGDYDWNTEEVILWRP